MKKRILLIEDHADLRENTAELLILCGYEVEPVSNGADGLAAAMRQAPDLIISDLYMPGMDGYELVRLLQATERTCAIPVIMSSANFNRSTFETDVNGINAYLAKPFDEEKLILFTKQALLGPAL